MLVVVKESSKRPRVFEIGRTPSLTTEEAFTGAHELLNPVMVPFPINYEIHKAAE